MSDAPVSLAAGTHRGVAGAYAASPPSGRADRSACTAELVQALARTRDPAEARRLREEIVLTNRPVADAIAARYRGRGVGTEDLRQAAYEGLVKAVERFDPALGNDLLTFAVPTVRGELQRYFRDTGWTVRPPRRIQELQWRLAQHTSTLQHRLSRDPTPVELAASLGVDVKELEEARVAHGAFSPASLDRPVRAGSDVTVGDLLPAPDDEVGGAEARHVLGQAMRVLTERERRIVHLRFWEDQLQREIGEELGITQMQVSRLLSSIAVKLRRAVDGQSAFDADAGPPLVEAASA